MLNLMMFAGSQMDVLAQRLGASPFRLVLAAAATLAPQALVSYAAASAADAVARAQIVVGGTERIVLALALALALRALHAVMTRSHRRPSMETAGGHPAALDMPGALA